MNCNCEKNRKMGKDFFLKNVKILHITERIFLVNLMKRLKQYGKK